ncbi:MAG: fused MFS/spermidine synthase [Myxococcales bacterium]|nr:fused MFS/spermidine synthase [Myxococcales bacterium]
MKTAPVYLLYVITGAFGLIYEVVWSRYLGLLMGNTAQAHAVVLATFMGGLALGASLFGRLADRVPHGLRLYGWIEVGVGLHAVFFPEIFSAFTELLGPLARAAGPGTTAMSGFKLLLAALAVLPPAVLMGGTLPVLTRHLTATAGGLRQGVGRLYALNSAGAVLGGLLAGFVLLEALGLPATIAGTGLVNTALGLLAVGLSIRLKPATAAATDGAQAEDAVEHDAAARRTALWLAAFSGFATMALEVAWIRWFGLMLGSSTHAFTLMLAAFISGIALGSFWLSRARAGRLPLLPLLGGALAVTAAALAVIQQLYDRMPYLVAHLGRAFAATPDAWPWFQAAVYGVCFLVMCLPTAVAGLVFPATVRLATERGRLGGRLGRVYAVNTVGTMAGSLLTGLVFFQWFGLEGVLRGVLVAYALAAIAVALRHMQGTARRRVIGLAVVVLGAHLALYRTADPRLLNQGLYRRNVDLGADFSAFRARVESHPLLFAAEGPHAVVTVRESGPSPVMDAPLRVMTVNGKPDASTGLDMLPQVFMGHLPLLLHPDPKRVFLVGLGSGITAGAIATHDVDLEVAEISEEVVQAQRFFQPYNNAPLENPRVRLVVEDARTVLRHGEGQFDVVISEPTNPWQSGVAGLFTVEFFDEVKARLAPGGIFAQWMHGYEADDATLGMVIMSLQDRFAWVTVFEMGDDDYLFVATGEPIHLDADRFAARMARPTVQADLARVGVTHPFALLALQVKAPERLRLEAQGEINADQRPLLELRAPRAFFVGGRSELFERIDDHHHLGGSLLADQWRAQRPLDADAVAGLYRVTAPFALSRSRRAALLRLLRRFFPAGDPRIVHLEHQTLVFNPEDSDAHLPLRELPAEAAAREPLRLAFERAILDFEGRFHRWAPPPVEPLERLVARLEIAAAGDAGWEARALRYRLRLLESVCARGMPACATQSAWFEARQPAEAPWGHLWAMARTEDALVRHDFPAAAQWLGRVAPSERQAELARRLAAVQAAMEPTP